MSTIMNQYELLEDFQNKHAGFSRWTYGKKNGKTYFLKEFLDPVYPTDESISLTTRKELILDCKEYETEKKKLYETINNVSDGNLIRISEFFRFENHYYIATDKVDETKITMEQIANLPFEERVLLCKTVAHSMMKLHEAHIVHADIKETNIIIKKTKTGKLVGKIIDFDAGFFEEKPPKYEDELGGDQVYLSPEGCQFVCGESVQLTCKMDVFALGLLFHQYLTGEMPKFDKEEYDYAFDAVLDNQPLEFSRKLPARWQPMIKGMLECDPKKRLSMKQVYSIFEEFDPNKGKVEERKTVSYSYTKSETSSSNKKSKVVIPSNMKKETKEESKESTGDWFHQMGDL